MFVCVFVYVLDVTYGDGGRRLLSTAPQQPSFSILMLMVVTTMAIIQLSHGASRCVRRLGLSFSCTWIPAWIFVLVAPPPAEAKTHKQHDRGFSYVCVCMLQSSLCTGRS